MPKPVLIAYASWTGSTREIAEFMARETKKLSVEAEVKPAAEVKDLKPYGGIILGSAIRAGRFHPAMVKFAGKWQKELAKKPVALFVVCLTMQKDTEENRCTVTEYIRMFESKNPGLEPVSVGLFGGMLDMKKLPGPIRLIMKAMKAVPGDYRDWEAARKWIRATVASLSKA
ncbi:MAG TPA: hypothetical protein ENN03_00840 [bacterium]|nr:hypothetical protein [bacterium]